MVYCKTFLSRRLEINLIPHSFLDDCSFYRSAYFRFFETFIWWKVFATNPTVAAESYILYRILQWKDSAFCSWNGNSAITVVNWSVLTWFCCKLLFIESWICSYVGKISTLIIFPCFYAVAELEILIKGTQRYKILYMGLEFVTFLRNFLATFDVEPFPISRGFNNLYIRKEKKKSFLSY